MMKKRLAVCIAMSTTLLSLGSVAEVLDIKDEHSITA